MTDTVRSTCAIDEALTTSLKQLRFRKATSMACMLVEIDRASWTIRQAEETMEDTSLEAIVDALPETTPRYLVLSYPWTHGDGRVSYPLIVLYYCPSGVPIHVKMLYASSQPFFVQQTHLDGKVYSLEDAEDLSEEWLLDRLNKT